MSEQERHIGKLSRELGPHVLLVGEVDFFCCSKKVIMMRE
jgi:hypothetical protein